MTATKNQWLHGVSVVTYFPSKPGLIKHALKMEGAGAEQGVGVVENQTKNLKCKKCVGKSLPQNDLQLQVTFKYKQ